MYITVFKTGNSGDLRGFPGSVSRGSPLDSKDSQRGNFKWRRCSCFKMLELIVYPVLRARARRTLARKAFVERLLTY